MFHIFEKAQRTPTTIDGVATIMRQLAIYANDIGQTLPTLQAWESSLKSPENVNNYIRGVTKGLYDRLVNGQKQYWPDVSDEELRKELCNPLRNYFERTKDKLVLRHSAERGKVQMHHLFKELYNLDGKDIVLTVPGSPLAMRVSPEFTNPSDELSITLNPEDATALFNWDKTLDKDKIAAFEQSKPIRADYKIGIIPAIQEEKKKEKIEGTARAVTTGPSVSQA